MRNFHDIECVALCSNGAKVIDALKKSSVDIVITYIQMPGKTGLDVAQYIHQNKLHIAYFLFFIKFQIFAQLIRQIMIFKQLRALLMKVSLFLHSAFKLFVLMQA